MATGRVISGSRLASSSMEWVWFSCNRVFSGFEFIFLKPEIDSGIVIPVPIIF